MANLCEAKGCIRVSEKRGFCPMHYWRWRKNGDPLKILRRPTGSGVITLGYKKIYVDKKQVFEHRYLMEVYLKRKLLPFPIEIVHHKNKNKLDNRIENLELHTQSEHASFENTRSIIKGKKRICRKCNQMLPLKSFTRIHKFKKGSSMYRAQCKKCQNEYNKKRRKKIKGLV